MTDGSRRQLIVRMLETRAMQLARSIVGRRSVKSKVTLVVTLLFLLSLLLVSTVQLYFVKAELKVVLANQQHALVSRVADELDQRIQINLNFLVAGARTLTPEMLRDVGQLEAWATQRQGLRAVFTDLFVISPDGIVLLDAPQRGRRGFDVSDREYLRITLETRKPHVSKPFVGKGTQQPVVSFSAPILDQDGRVVAVLTGTLNLLQANFLGNLAEAKVGQNGSFAVFTRDRTIVISSDKSRILTQGPAHGASPYFDRATSGLEGSEEAVNSRGLRAIFSYSPLKAVPWVLVASLPIEEAYAPIQTTQRRIVQATLLLGLLVAPLVWLAVRRLYDPLQAALREREAALQRAQSMAKLAHVITATDGGFESWSETLPKLMGVRPDQMPNSTREWLRHVHPDDRERFRLTSIDAGISRQRTDQYYRLQRPDGVAIEVQQSMEPIDQAGPDGKSRWFNTLQDITEQKQSEATLRESERRFSDMLAKVELVSLMLDSAGCITYCNDYLLRLTGWEREEVIGQNWFQFFIPPDAKGLPKAFQDLLADLPQAWHFENEILTKNQDRRLIRWNNSVLRSISGEAIGTASIGEDITDQKHAETKIRGLNRVHAVLSGINSLIVRVHDRDELFRESCRLAVDHGHFKTALISIVNPTAKTISLAALAGLQPDFIGPFRNGYPLQEDSPLRETIVARVVREGRAIVSNDVQSDPEASFAEECVALGIFSTAVLPLVVSNKVIGVFALLASEPGYFDDEEMKLLLELAGDISFALDHIEKAERLNYLAYYDGLTGLANRSLFLERLEERLLAARKSGNRLAVTLLDVERLRSINDAFGRQAGDQLLQQVATRLTNLRGDATRLARIGVETFGVVSADVQNEGDVGRMTEHKLQTCFDPPFRIGEQELRIPAKAGISMYPNDGNDAEVLLRCAESALQRAKSQGERYLFFEPRMTERIAERLSLEEELRQAVERQEFVLYYQAKVDTPLRTIVGVEALIRWQSPTRGLVPPAQFIPLLEETGLILPVGAWALKRATLDYRRWVEADLNAPRVAVNVSAVQLRQKDFVRVVEESVGAGLSQPGIDLEVTESLVIEDIAGSVEKLRALRALGMGIALDDFGTGYSSLAYLAKLPIESLKIDRSFVILMLNDPGTMTLVETIISMAHSLRLKVIAEGVETEAQAATLLRLRCDQMQGYLFSKPLAFEEMTVLLSRAVTG